MEPSRVAALLARHRPTDPERLVQWEQDVALLGTAFQDSDPRFSWSSFVALCGATLTPTT